MNSDKKLISLISKTLPLILQHQSVEDALWVISGLFAIECNDIIHPNKSLNFLTSKYQSKKLIQFANDLTLAITETLLAEGYSSEQIDEFLDTLTKQLDRRLFSN